MFRHAELPTSGAASPDADIDLVHDDLPPHAPRRFGRLALWIASASALGIGVAGTVGYKVWFNQDQRAYVEAMAIARQELGITQATLAAQTLSTGIVEPTQAYMPGEAPSALGATGAAPYAAAEPAPAPGLAALPAQTAAQTAAQIPDPLAPVSTATAAILAAAEAAPSAPSAAPATAAAPSAAAVAVATARPAPTARTTQAARRSARMASASPNPQQASTRASRQNPAVSQNRRHPATHAKPDESLFARMGSFFHRVSYRQNGNSSQRDEYSRP